MKKENKELLARLPKEVMEVCANYSGSGDEGNFDEITFLDSGSKSVEVAAEIETDFQNMFEEILEKEYAGWENSDGGSGNFTLNVKKQSIVHNHSEYYTSANEHSRTLRL